MQVYRVAAIRLMWTYNELMKYKTNGSEYVCNNYTHVSMRRMS